METGLIKVGSKIEMTLIKDNSGKNVKINKKYTSQLLEYISKRIAKISMPIEQNRLVPLSIGEEHFLCFFTDKGLYRCKAKITDRYKERNVFVLVVNFLTEPEKFQRRNYFRIDYNTEAKIRLITSDEIMFEKLLLKDDFSSLDEKAECYELLKRLQSNWKTVMLIDLSGGGARIQSKMQFTLDDVVKIAIPMFGRTIKQYSARVIASIRLPNEISLYDTRLEFVDMNETEREFLVKSIFNEQRRRVKGV